MRESNELRFFQRRAKERHRANELPFFIRRKQARGFRRKIHRRVQKQRSFELVVRLTDALQLAYLLHHGQSRVRVSFDVQPLYSFQLML